VGYLPESLIADVPKVVAGLPAGQSFKTILVPASSVIIGKLKDGAPGESSALPGSASLAGGVERPPTPATKKYAVTMARQQRVRLPAGHAERLHLSRVPRTARA